MAGRKMGSGEIADLGAAGAGERVADMREQAAVTERVKRRLAVSKRLKRGRIGRPTVRKRRRRSLNRGAVAGKKDRTVNGR